MSKATSPSNTPDATPATPASDTTQPAAPAAAPAPAPLAPEAIEAIRQEESKKLQGKIQELERQAEEGRKTAAQKAETERKLVEVQAQLDAVSKAKTADGTLDVKTLVAEVTQTVRNEAEARTKELENRLNAQEAERRREKLEFLRKQLINDAGGKTIPSMIQGSTEEELQASAKRAAEQYNEIVASVRPAAPAGDPNPQPSPGSLPPTVNPRANNGGGAPAPVGLDTFDRNISVKEYAKNRGALLAELKRQHG